MAKVEGRPSCFFKKLDSAVFAMLVTSKFIRVQFKR